MAAGSHLLCVGVFLLDEPQRLLPFGCLCAQIPHFTTSFGVPYIFYRDADADEARRLLSIFYPCVSQYTAHSLMVLLTYSDVFWAYLDIRALSSATMSSLCSDHDELIVVSCIRRLPSTISTYFCRAFFQLIYQGISFPSEWRNCPPSFARVDASTIWRIVLATSATEGASGFASTRFFIQPLVSADMLYCTVSGILRVR